jgi:hypothetical protein
MMPTKEKNKEVIKHSAAIQITNNITLLQRKAWNVLLYNAYYKLPTQDTHTINVRDLMEILGFNSQNDDYLKEALEALVGCRVKWNLLDKDGKWEWEVTTLLAGARIKNGVCTYAYNPMLRERLYKPNMYARISLALQNRFDSKHTLTLWELCTDYLDKSRGYGETPWIDLTNFRELMGLTGNMYPDFKIFNRSVIKPAVKEINEVSDFTVTVEYKRQSRKVVSVKFKVRQVQQLPKVSNKQGTLFPDREDMPPVVQELIGIGLVRHEALKIWNQGFDFVDPDKRPEGIDFDTYLREKIHLLNSQPEGRVESETAWLIDAIKNNYSHPKFAQQQQKQAREERQEKIRELKRQKEEIEKAYEETCERAFQEIAQNHPTKVHDAIQEALIENPPFQRFYDASKSFTDQSMVIQAMARAKLREKFTDMFRAIDGEHKGKLSEIDQQITQLQG